MMSLGYKTKLVYFDRSIIRSNWRKINETPVKRSGLLVRRIARGSIRHVKTFRPSPRGMPPRSRHPAKPFKLIYSIPFRMDTAVIVGTVGFNTGGHPVPGRHEHGDRFTANTLANPPVPGPKRTSTGQYRKRPRLTAKQWEHIKQKRPVMVRRMVNYPKRPFMEPALRKAAPRFPAMWEGSLGR